ncbi:MAG: molybdate ABC transporter substrate-binding protein [Fusobacterium sp.]|nr:molybdate ABC transporter substrate-binding protein [Fusobacterium sp.]
MLSLFLLTACNKSKNDRKEIFISAASSLTNVIDKVKEEYEKENKDIVVRTNYAGSGTLQVQIEEGAPVDLFISASNKQMNILESKNLISKDNRISLLKNKVVLIVPKNYKLKLENFEDVLKNEVKKIAIAEPQYVPIGQYSEEIFSNLKIWEKVKEKMITSQNVRQSLDWVVTGNVDCATVYQTDAYMEKEKVSIVAQAPENTYKKISYPLAIIKNSENKEEVKNFYEFLNSAKAKEIFKKYGFVVND